MGQRGFANIVLMVIIIAVVAVGGYFIFSNRSVDQTGTELQQMLNEEMGEQDASYAPQENISGGDWVRQPRTVPKGADFVVDEDRIQVLSPKGGEKLEVGKNYEIRWNFPIYRGSATATIFLRAVPPSPWVRYEQYDNVIAENVLARGGNFQWRITQPSFDNYKIDIYSPEIGTEFRGLSKPFLIVGGSPLAIDTSLNPPLRTDNLEVDSPLDGQEVTNPIIVKGRARNIFFEGEFQVELRGYDYPLGDPRYAESSRVITSTYARIVSDCDWMRGQWCDFEAVVNYPPAGTGVKGENMLYFYAGGQGPVSRPGGTVEDILNFLRGEGTSSPSSVPVFIAALRINLK